MKKFFTTIPPQQKTENLTRGNYIAVDNEKLTNDLNVSFPVLPLIKGYYTEGEEIEIIAFYIECYENSKPNKEKFESQVAEVLKENTYTIKYISIAKSETIDEHLNTFEQLIENIQEGDILYADITFGNKPLPIIQIMALNYAIRSKNDVIVECLTYGENNFITDEKKIYDVTSLLYMDEIVNNLARAKVQNPIEAIKRIIASEE